MSKVDATAQMLGRSGAARPAADEAGLDVLMREFFHRKPGADGPRGAAEALAVAHPDASKRDFDMVDELLDRASQAFDMLIGRCQLLKHDLDDANERAVRRAAEQDEAIEQWKRLASGLKAQVKSSEQATAVLKVRCAAAETRAAEAEKRAAALEHASAQAAAQAATADHLSTKLRDRVVAAFGIGSRAHPVLEAVTARAAAE